MSNEGRPRLLVFAYACEPGRGSEPGAGWGFVRALSEWADCTVLVGPAHIQSIRKWQAENDRGGLQFVEIAEPWWAPATPRRRFTWFGVYLGWLKKAGRVARRLHAADPFDAGCHVTYSTYWLPTPLTDLGIPFIWGPVGGAVLTPVPLWSVLGLRGLATEWFDLVAVRVLATLPSARRAARAAVVLVQNEETRDRLPEPVRARAVVLNHAMFTELPVVPRLPRGRSCLLVGALERRKGAALAIRAVAAAGDEVSLHIVGDGPDRRRLNRLAKRLGVAGRVRFEGNLPRTDVMRHLATSAAVVFTGLREEGGLALAEAMLAGTPVIVLANGGARTIAVSATDPSRVALIEPGDTETTVASVASAMRRFTARLSPNTGPMLDVAAAREALHQAVERVTFRGSANRLTA